MMSPFDPKKILVIQTASIGDVILATPLLEKLHSQFPDASLDFLLKKGTESLFTGHPFIHKVIIWDKSQKKYSNLLDTISLIRDTKYDLVLNIQRFSTSGIVTALSGAKVKIGFNKNPFSIFFSKRVKHIIGKENVHEVDRNLMLIQPLKTSSRVPIKLYPSQADFAKMSQYKTSAFITVSPASLWFTKQFPFDKWANFIRMTDPNLVVYFLGSGKDREICNDIIKLSGHKNSLNLAGKLSFLESTALMRDAQMNFMNDSAPMHLASSVNARTTAIFCSTVKEFGFGPLSDDSVIIETSEKLDCRPCGLHGFQKCPKEHFKCATTINEEELLKRLQS